MTPEEKVADLENKIADIKANCDLAIEGRDIKIKELEKQVKDLEWQLQEVAKDNDYYQAENKRLEKENAELGMKRKAERQIFQGIVEKKNEQLTKAKEIIKKMLYEHQRLCLIKKETIADAEQFLKEIDKC